ncbi:hypothetical protein GCM10010446_33410 [Streptomyces enissocaesilis]|uniref:Uncharacterized protein n=1 Tax=Streptomyces enissocaesilis TaxID=332589 RepID=A0ABN3XA22_9ACTN
MVLLGLAESDRLVVVDRGRERRRPGRADRGVTRGGRSGRKVPGVVSAPVSARGCSGVYGSSEVLDWASAREPKGGAGG